MLVSILSVVLCVSGSKVVTADRVVDCVVGQECAVLCALQFNAVMAWFKSEQDGSYTTVAKATDPPFRRVSLSVIPRREKALVYMQSLLERDAGEYWCGYWTMESNEESLYLQERILLRVHKALIIQTSTSTESVAAPVCLSNSTDGTTGSLGSHRNIVLIIGGITLVLSASLVGLFIIRRKGRQKAKVGTAGHLDCVHSSKFPYSNEPVLTDITYAVLTLNTHGPTEEGRFSNAHPDRPMRLPEVVEYSSLSF